jgi:hypothetical protein
MLRNLLLDRVLRACIASQGRTLETPSSPDGFVRLADPTMGKRVLGRFAYYPYYSPCSSSRLRLAMFFEDMRSKRRLMEIAADRLSIRRYLGTGLRSAPATAGTAEHLSRPA